MRGAPARLPVFRDQRLTEVAQERIRAAALVEFATRGYAEARVADIARIAGCNVSALYVEWPSKATLYEEVLARATVVVYRAALACRAAARGGAGEAAADGELLDGPEAKVVVRECLAGGAETLTTLTAPGTSLRAALDAEAAAVEGSPAARFDARELVAYLRAVSLRMLAGVSARLRGERPDPAP